LNIVILISFIYQFIVVHIHVVDQ